MDYSYLGNRLSKDLAGYLKEYLPTYTDIDLLSRLIVDTVICEKTRDGSDPLMLDPEPYLLILAKDFARRISGRIFTLKDKVVGYLRTNFKILLLVGAGLSYESGLPLTKHLQTVLRAIGIQTTDNYCDLCKAFEKVRRDPTLENEFKQRFRNLIQARNVNSSSHTLIAKKFLQESIQEIFCLNWDDLIEQSYEKLNSNSPIKKVSKEIDCPQNTNTYVHALWKLNGDVDDINTDWIYPGEEGRVFRSLDNYLEFLSKQNNFTFVSLAVGYSESDENINGILSRINKFTTIFRIGMDMRLFSKYDDYLLAPAEWILPQLLIT